MEVLHDFLGNFDKLNQLSSTSGAHSPLSFKEDVKLILNELNTAFECTQVNYARLIFDNHDSIQ